MLNKYFASVFEIKGPGALPKFQDKSFDLNLTESPIFVILCVLCFQRLSFFILFYSTVACVVPCGGRKKSLPVHHHSAGYILFPL